MQKEGPRFLFIHGAGGTSSKWRRMPKEIAIDNPIIINLRDEYFLKEENPSISKFASMISERLDEEVIVVGHSMGGLIGIELASINLKVKGLVLAASHYRIPVDQKILEQLKSGEFPKGLFYASYSKNVANELLEEEIKDNEKVPVQISYQDFYACNEYVDGEKVIKQLDIPMLAILGQKDRLLPRSVSKDLSQLNLPIEITFIKDAGHFVMLENPEEFYRTLFEFRNMYF